MKKIEIVANNSIEFDLLDALEAVGIQERYTKVQNVLGNGSCGGRLGTPVWPEENFILILYVEDDKVESLRHCCELIKNHFPDEGLKMVVWDVNVLV